MPTKRRRIGPRRRHSDEVIRAFLEGREPVGVPADEAFLRLRFWKNSEEGRRVLAEREEACRARGRKRG
jgi:hypothetical protein